MDARRLVDEAVGMPVGAQRTAVLHAAERLARVDDPDLVPVVLALLSSEEPQLLPEARSLLRDVAPGNRADRAWALAHLIDSAAAIGAWTDALELSLSFDHSYFVNGDLRWRSVRADEVHTAALLELGFLEAAIEAADGLLASFTKWGDTDDLAPPIVLVRTALEVFRSGSPAARLATVRVLQAVSNTLELDSWFPQAVIDEITDTLERR